MKKWVSPELYELKAEWTQDAILTKGSDSHGEHGTLDNGSEVDLGSCC